MTSRSQFHRRTKARSEVDAVRWQARQLVGLRALLSAARTDWRIAQLLTDIQSTLDSLWQDQVGSSSYEWLEGLDADDVPVLHPWIRNRLCLDDYVRLPSELVGE